MGITLGGNSNPHQHRTHKCFLFCIYTLLAAASSSVFLTLSLRLLPSLCGFFLILLQAIIIAATVTAGSVATGGSNKMYAAHMITTVLTSICQGSVSVLILTRTTDFLGYLKSYVREEDGIVILKMAGGLCVLVFCLEWVMLSLSFVLRYNSFLEGNGQRISPNGSSKTQEEDLKNWPWPFQV